LAISGTQQKQQKKLEMLYIATSPSIEVDGKILQSFSDTGMSGIGIALYPLHGSIANAN